MPKPFTYSATELTAIVGAVKDYDYGHARTALIALETLINRTYGERAARVQIETAMADLLGSTATRAAKQFVCKLLWFMGTSISVPALGRLLEGSDSVLAEAACYALRTQQSAESLSALLQGLARTRGTVREAIINILGDRRAQASTTYLVALSADKEAQVAECAIAALGKIASPEGTAALMRIFHSSNPVRRDQSAHALLQAGQELAMRDDRAAAKAILSELIGAAQPSQIRRGAKLCLKGMI